MAKLESWCSIILGKLEFLRRLAFPPFLDYDCFLLCKADKALNCPQFDMATATLCVTATLLCHHPWAGQCSWSFTYGFHNERLPGDLNKTTYGLSSLIPKEIKPPGATTSLWGGKARQGENTIINKILKKILWSTVSKVRNFVFHWNTLWHAYTTQTFQSQTHFESFCLNVFTVKHLDWSLRSIPTP